MDLERWYYRLRLWLRALFHRRQVEDDLREELADHLERQIAEHRAAGLSPAAARTAALRALRGLELRKEECRETWQVRALDQLLQDLRYGARSIRRSPAFTAVAILSLALGIGANTALFSLLDAVMLKQLPVRDPGQLQLLEWSSDAFPALYVDDLEGDCTEGGRMTCLVFSSADFERLRLRNTVFADTMAFASNDAHVNVGLRGGGAHDALAQAVSGNFFPGLRVAPALGRALQPGDDAAGAPPVVVVSHGFWQRQLGGDPAAVGQTLAVNGTAAVVVGVAPPEFFGLRPGTAPALWIPLSLYADQMLHRSGENLIDPRVWWLSVVGRLKPGTTAAAATAQITVLFRQGLAADPAAAARQGSASSGMPRLAIRSAARGLADLRERFSTPLLLLMGMVGLVLLITCANVAGLLLAKTAARQPEIALRVSLGARRLRIVRQLLTESVLLALLGGALGLLAAGWIRTALAALLASGRTPIVVAAPLDHRVLLFTAAVALGSGILFGLAPALRASRMEVKPAANRSAGTRAAPVGHFFAGKALVASQVAFSVVLLVGAGLFLRTLEKLLAIDLGFDQRRLVVFTVQPGLNGLAADRLAAFYQELERRVAAIPGVRSVGFSLLGPVGAGSSRGIALVPGITAAGKSFPFFRHRVDPGFFAAMGLPAVQGRLLGPRDTAAAHRVAVVNERLVKDQLHGASPLGRLVQMGGKTDQAEIVGVVRNLRTNEIRDEAPAGVYLSYLQTPRIPAFMTYVVRCRRDEANVMRAVERIALQLDPEIPVSDLRTETDMIDRSLMLEHTFAVLSGGFAGLALLLACVGLYGTIGYAVARRTHEIGVRMALGARRQQILGSVLAETLRVVLAGLAVGVPAAALVVRVIKSRLFGISAHDPATFVLAILPLVAAAVLAGLLPARQASSVNPTVALRAD
jgi:predicted permease